MSNIRKYLSLTIVSTWSILMLLSVANAETEVHAFFERTVTIQGK